MEIISQVLSVFDQLDRQVTEFQIKTGLRCPTGCGVCCPAADVQTTPLEMLPAACEIFSQGAVDRWFERLAIHTPTEVCVFYQVDRPSDEAGHCSFYRWRPAICRLFGFAAVHTRTGTPSLALCGHLKRSHAETTVRALECQAQAPGFSALTTQLYSMEPAGKLELMPINQALRKAMLRVGLRLHMASGEVSSLSLRTVA